MLRQKAYILYLSCYGLIVLSFISCAKEESLTGDYHSYDTGFLGLLDSNKYTIGDSLTLNTDSTFVRKNCAQITHGMWTVKRDSLFLHCDSIRFIVDSINHNPKYKKGTICSSEPEVFTVDGNKLKAKLKMKNGEEVHTKLKKE